ncbi:condensation domain-containing protein [Aureispira anguillae]|uniref:Condensation domain-containing protein n=1 Tax=Aureispira anguillae TaxID=2864201 RepID=A0A915YDP9_9BACT|nr:condensation domain-containing protein [Aureispira anguillae]BDS11131.1 condensation domain-containing protein [Aureispira anguillae]
MKIKLSGILRFFISSPNTNIVTGVALNAIVSKEAIEQALNKVAQQHCFLRMVPIIDENNDAYLLLKPDLTILVKEYQDVAYDVLAHQELQVVHQLNQKPLIHFVLNQREAHTDLMVVANHAICDGMSLNNLLKHIIQVLNGQELPPIPDYQPIEALAPALQDSWSQNMLIKLVNKLWQKKDLILTQPMINQVYKNYWDNRATKVLIEDFSSEMTTAIIAHCKTKPYSVNTFLGTLFLYARQAAEVYKKPTIKNFMITANLRPKLLKDTKQAMGCYVNSIKLDLPKHYEQPIEVYAQALQQKVSEWFDSMEPLSLLTLLDIKASVMDAANLNKYGLRKDWLIQKLIKQFDLTKVNTELILTNYGVMQPNISGSYQIAHYLPVVVSSAMTIEKYISIYTYKGQLRIGICYDAKVISESDMKQYVQTFKRLLKKQLSIKQLQLQS